MTGLEHARLLSELRASSLRCFLSLSRSLNKNLVSWSPPSRLSSAGNIFSTLFQIMDLSFLHLVFFPKIQISMVSFLPSLGSAWKLFIQQLSPRLNSLCNILSIFLYSCLEIFILKMGNINGAISFCYSLSIPLFCFLLTVLAAICFSETHKISGLVLLFL